MRQIVCEDCKKHYDYDKNEFCPRCGAFNQPVKTWTTDSQGNVRRVDGVNEQNHAGSFAHSEVHKEKRIRQIKGMDKGGRLKTAGREQYQTVAHWKYEAKTKGEKRAMSGIVVVVWIVVAIIFFNVLLPLLGWF